MKKKHAVCYGNLLYDCKENTDICPAFDIVSNGISLMISIERQQKIIYVVRTAGLIPPPSLHACHAVCTQVLQHSEVLGQVIRHTTTLPLHHVRV
jgi:hypothetical protein